MDKDAYKEKLKTEAVAVIEMMDDMFPLKPGEHRDMVDMMAIFHLYMVEKDKETNNE